MNSRERVLAAINREPVDRVPTDIWATPEVWHLLESEFGSREAAQAALHIDGMASIAPEYIGPPLPEVPDGETVDFWGMKTIRQHHSGGFYDEQNYYPLAEATAVKDLDRYAWPTTDWFDYSGLRPAAESARTTQAVMCGYMAPFFFHNKLRGLEQSLMDPLSDPELAHEVIARISDFFFEHHRRMFVAAEGLIDIAQVTDDLGSQAGPLISPEIYEDFYAPQHKRFIDLCHEFGIKVFHHDDGSCRRFLPLLIDMGIDVLNPIQWTCPGMEMPGLKQDFGDRICFHGAIENQRIMPFGTPEEVRAEVRHCIDALASDGTGYILAPCHNLQGNTPLANIIALYDEAWHYGETVGAR